MSEAFSQCRSRADYLRKLIDVENEAAPLEMRELWNCRHELPQDAVTQLQATLDMMAACAPVTRPFVRTPLSPQANLFAWSAPSAHKSLLVCFCGVANRMMLPIPVFLQLVAADRFDVLILKDPTGWGYLRGVPGLGDTLPEVTDAIAARLDLASYADVRCLGVSSGGAAALYAGVLLEAARAVSVGGRHRSLAAKPQGEGKTGGGLTDHEFDQAIRDRATGASTRLIAVFGANAPRDREGAASLRAHLPSCEMRPVADVKNHNVLALLLKNGALQSFLDDVLFSPGCGPRVARVEENGPWMSSNGSGSGSSGRFAKIRRWFSGRITPTS